MIFLCWLTDINRGIFDSLYSCFVWEVDRYKMTYTDFFGVVHGLEKQWIL